MPGATEKSFPRTGGTSAPPEAPGDLRLQFGELGEESGVKFRRDVNADAGRLITSYASILVKQHGNAGYGDRASSMGAARGARYVRRARRDRRAAARAAAGVG